MISSSYGTKLIQNDRVRHVQRFVRRSNRIYSVKIVIKYFQIKNDNKINFKTNCIKYLNSSQKKIVQNKYSKYQGLPLN